MKKNHHHILALSLLGALIAGVSSPLRAADAASAAKAPPPEILTAGAAVYNKVCFVCHQPTGTGLPGVFPPLAKSPIVTGDPRRIVRIVLAGLSGPVEVNGMTYNSVMPGHATTLNDAEIASVLTYIRNSWGNQAEVVPASLVAAERSANRTAPWTWAELSK
jgi:nitrite reductase (NO-forming)